MKNYKHSTKSFNKMKLAAFASAAVMLAPVAMTSVSTFADGTSAAGADYPAYSIWTVSQAAQAKENGTSGQISSSMNQGATTGYNTADVAAAIAAVKAISTGDTQTTNANYKTSAQKLIDAGQDAVKTAEGLNNGLKGAGSYYNQLTTAEKSEQEGNISTIQTKYSAIVSDVTTKGTALMNAATDADNAITNAEKPGADQLQQDVAASMTAKYAKAASDFQTAVSGFTSFNTAVTSYNNAVARKTNNGAVRQAAATAGAAINSLPAGDLKTQLTNEFNKAQGDYYLATTKDASNADNAKAMDKAASDAVATLNDIAGDAFKGGANVTSGANSQAGVVKVNYPAGYGIQIWTAAGKAVRYNAKEAALNNKKTGDAKKLPGQKSYKVFKVDGKSTVTMNGTTYYNLGGDQYIDAAYVTFTAVK